MLGVPQSYRIFLMQKLFVKSAAKSASAECEEVLTAQYTLLTVNIRCGIANTAELDECMSREKNCRIY